MPQSFTGAVPVPVNQAGKPDSDTVPPFRALHGHGELEPTRSSYHGVVRVGWSRSQGFPIPADNFPNELAHVCNSVGKSPAWRDSDAAFQVSFSLRYHLACPGISEQIKPLQLVGYSAELRFDSKF